MYNCPLYRIFLGWFGSGSGIAVDGEEYEEEDDDEEEDDEEEDEEDCAAEVDEIDVGMVGSA